LHQLPEFFEEMIDVNSLGDDQTDIERAWSQRLKKIRLPNTAKDRARGFTD
jgi:hypothetical protein